MALPSITSVASITSVGAPDSPAVLRLREKLELQSAEIKAEVDRVLESPRFQRAAQLHADTPVQRSYAAQSAAPDSPSIRRTLDKLVSDLSKYTPQIDARRITP